MTRSSKERFHEHSPAYAQNRTLRHITFHVIPVSHGPPTKLVDLGRVCALLFIRIAGPLSKPCDAPG